MIWLHARPLPPTYRKTEKEKQFAYGRGGGRGAESYDRKKAWSFNNHLITLWVEGLCFVYTVSTVLSATYQQIHSHGNTHTRPSHVRQMIRKPV